MTQIPFYLRTFANRKQLVGLSLVHYMYKRGKSGQHRASYFLTESCRKGRVMQKKITASPHRKGKDEKVG